MYDTCTYMYSTQNMLLYFVPTLNDLPSLIVTNLPTSLLLKEIKLCATDKSIPVQVHPMEYLLQCHPTLRGEGDTPTIFREQCLAPFSFVVLWLEVTARGEGNESIRTSVKVKPAYPALHVRWRNIHRHCKI